MTKRPRKKPTTSEAARQERERRVDFAAVNLPDDAATNPNHADIEVTRSASARDGRKVDADSARRLDAFSALQASMRRKEFVGAYDAARRFERDLFVSLGLHDRGPAIDRVDGTPPKGDRTDAMIAASRQVVGIKLRLPDRDWWLLNELVNPTRLEATWRVTVSRITGEANWNAQGAVVRALCVNVRDAYAALDVERRKAA